MEGMRDFRNAITYDAGCGAPVSLAKATSPPRHSHQTSNSESRVTCITDVCYNQQERNMDNNNR